jgi:nitroimidazol reductase NimA-like FMN-containing flavoprotein (pyridoxamine 5'-phosphate oxidase superfamily)
MPVMPATQDSEPAHHRLVELTREECLELLAGPGLGRLVVVMDGRPVIRPVNYGFDDRSQSVVFRTARGSKLSALTDAASAAFEIDGVDESTHTGWSVIISGVTEVITRPADIRRLEGLGLETWAPSPSAHWVRVRAWAVSGRRIEAR